MKILFIVPYPVGVAPSQRLKFEQYFDCFRSNGITIKVSPFIDHRFIKILYEKGFYFKKILYTLKGYLRRIADIFQVKNFDLVYLHLEAAPFGPPVFEYIISKMGKPIIYDIDDIVYIPHASQANRFVKFLKYPRKITAILRLSSHIIVVTRYLEVFARKYNKNVTFIPPTIDTNKYFIKQKGATHKICVGWTGSHSTSAYLVLLENVLRRLAEKYDIRIKAIGDKKFKIGGLNIEAKSWSADDEVGDIQDIDIGLYPLPKNEWVMGKGGLKALQYMGMGVPAVCTRVGAVLDFIQDGVNGFLADSDEEWIEKVSRLIEDFDMRTRMGLAARETVINRYSVEANAPKYMEILRNCRIDRR